MISGDLENFNCSDLILVPPDSARRRGSNGATPSVGTDSTKIHSSNIPSGAVTSQVWFCYDRRLRETALQTSHFWRNIQTQRYTHSAKSILEFFLVVQCDS